MSSTRVARKGEKTVVYMGGGGGGGGQQLQGSGSNITISSCGQGPSRSRGTVYRMPNGGATGASEIGAPASYLPGCTTTVSLENMASSSEPKIVRVVPRGTTILLEEVKPPTTKSQSGRSKSRLGSPTIQVVEECDGGAGYGPSPRRSEPGPGEHCIECLAELVQRRRTERRLDQGPRNPRRLVASVTAEISEEDGDDDDGPNTACCPACGVPVPASRLW